MLLREVKTMIYAIGETMHITYSFIIQNNEWR